MKHLVMPAIRPKASSSLVAATILIMLASTATPLHAFDYLVRAGDVVEINVAGMPELKHRAPVQFDGTLSVPLAGSLDVAGLRPAELQSKLQSTLASRLFKIRLPDGRERPVVIEYGEISASIVEYAPIYVTGTVLRAGSHTFKPHITVRQAIAAAGGLEERARSGSFRRDAIELQTDYTSNWVTYAKEQLSIWRLKSELGESGPFDYNLLIGAPLPMPAVAELVNTETEGLRSRQAENARERSRIETALSQAHAHAAALQEQMKSEEETVKADQSDLQRITALYQRGYAAMPRMSEVRRVALQSSSRHLQTRSQLVAVRRQINDLSHDKRLKEEQRRLTVLGELQESQARLNIVKAKLIGAGERLGITNINNASPKIEPPHVVIHRVSDKGTMQIDAALDTELLPGDVVEVAYTPSAISHVALR